MERRSGEEFTTNCDCDGREEIQMDVSVDVELQDAQEEIAAGEQERKANEEALARATAEQERHRLTLSTHYTMGRIIEERSMCCGSFWGFFFGESSEFEGMKSSNPKEDEPEACS